MVTPYQLSQVFFTRAQIAAWLGATEYKRLDLQRLFAEPWNYTLREQAFLRMSELVQEGLEVIRVLSDTLPAHREAWRARSAPLQERSVALGAQSAPTREQPCQQEPSAQEIHAAEPPLRDMFTDCLRYVVRGPRTPRGRQAS